MIITKTRSKYENIYSIEGGKEDHRDVSLFFRELADEIDDYPASLNIAEVYAHTEGSLIYVHVFTEEED